MWNAFIAKWKENGMVSMPLNGYRPKSIFKRTLAWPPLGHNVWNGANERERKREIGTDQTGRRLDPNTVIVISETQRTARRTPINNTTGS